MMMKLNVMKICQGFGFAKRTQTKAWQNAQIKYTMIDYCNLYCQFGRKVSSAAFRFPPLVLENHGLVLLQMRFNPPPSFVPPVKQHILILMLLVHATSVVSPASVVTYEKQILQSRSNEH